MAPPQSYRRLEATQIQKTVSRLRDRIDERFPGRGLGRVAEELTAVATESGARADAFGRGHTMRRVVALVLVGFLVVSVLLLGLATVQDDGVTDLASFVSTLEAGLGSLFLLGAVVAFLLTYEGRRNRERLLAALDDIRSMAHVIDMHALTKHPEKLLMPGASTKSSHKDQMDIFGMSRYLNYCSEMMDLCGKLAAVYVRDVHDPISLSSADDLESLTGGLSRKIWQKIMLLGEVVRLGPDA